MLLSAAAYANGNMPYFVAFLTFNHTLRDELLPTTTRQILVLHVHQGTSRILRGQRTGVRPGPRV